MKLKTLKEKISFDVLLGGLVVFIFFLFLINYRFETEEVSAFFVTSKIIPLSQSIQPTKSVQEAQEVKNSRLPVLLKIPKIKVNSQVEYVGITSDGAMDVPKNIKNVAWFKLGVAPGEIGTAIIAGHYGWKNGKSSAFDNLSKLKKGDKLFVEDGKGNKIYFVVRDIKKYDAKADSKDVFNSSDNKSHLNLITCGGVWNKIEKSYASRLVIFTDKEEI